MMVLRASFASIISLAALAAPQTSAASEAQVIAVNEREPLAVVVFSPVGVPGGLVAADFTAPLSAELERKTGLSVDAVDPTLMSECGGKLSCIALKVRPDYIAGAKPAKDHRHPRLLLLVTVVDQKGKGSRATVSLVDAELALREYYAADRSAPDWEEATEALVNERAVLIRPRWIAVKDRADVEKLLTGVVEDQMKPILEDAGQWLPYGEIEIEGLAPGALVQLDGLPVGTANGQAMQIAHVMHGHRAITLEHAAYLPLEIAADVEAGKSAHLRTRMIAKDPGIGPAVRSGVFWGGVGLAAGGVAISAFALFRQRSDVAVYCFGPPMGSTCSASQQFQRSGYSPSVAPTFENKLNSGGVLLLPLGYALVGAGAVWALGTELFSDDSDLPWIPVVAGIAVAVAAYGISAAADGKFAYH
jgi:hypothetical protein